MFLTSFGLLTAPRSFRQVRVAETLVLWLFVSAHLLETSFDLSLSLFPVDGLYDIETSYFETDSSLRTTNMFSIEVNEAGNQIRGNALGGGGCIFWSSFPAQLVYYLLQG